ncbi:hypothetical protein L2K70_03980 [Nocardioides KLBMP 9356]|uniref:EfeO-type cupredoxin-like domain-containing protein n=1 Tax=Nocardioides potassii TaxID=2911371 RepID=A0ABS9H8H6_9ACTN|nr:hypothetical protein [Nocardioides potassii]MCF6376754.1 hypothetical protein [Nocardioides potassii]
MRLPLRAAPLVLVLGLGLTACGGDDSPADSAGPTTDGDAVAITVTRKGDDFTPNGERVELGVDQTLTLTIDADQAGELHVHSTPEQEIEYDAGTSEHELTIDRPGVVEVESHEPDVVLLQLEVR